MNEQPPTEKDLLRMCGLSRDNLYCPDVQGKYSDHIVILFRNESCKPANKKINIKKSFMFYVSAFIDNFLQL